MQTLSSECISNIFNDKTMKHMVIIRAFLDKISSKHSMLAYKSTFQYWRHGSNVELIIFFKGETATRQFDLLSKNFTPDFKAFTQLINALIKN